LRYSLFQDRLKAELRTAFSMSLHWPECGDFAEAHVLANVATISRFWFYFRRDPNATTADAAAQTKKAKMPVGILALSCGRFDEP
jgi:hypothetical protein